MNYRRMGNSVKKTGLGSTPKWGGLLLAVIGAVCLAPTAATAGMIQIQLGGVDFGYDGADLVDMGTSGPDSLTNATFLADNVLLGVDTTNVTLDLDIPDVIEIPIIGGQVISSTGGSIDLNLGGGEYISLTLDQATIAYLPLVGTVQFVFVATDGNLVDQNLPYGLSMADPISVSFSTQIIKGSVSDDGTYITAFRSSGTGELTGVPEPATMTLLVLGGMTVLARRRRRGAA